MLCLNSMVESKVLPLLEVFHRKIGKLEFKENNFFVINIGKVV